MRVAEARHHPLHQHQQLRGPGSARSESEPPGEHHVPEDRRVPAGGADRDPRGLQAAGAAQQGDHRQVYGAEGHIVERGAVVGLAERQVPQAAADPRQYQSDRRQRQQVGAGRLQAGGVLQTAGGQVQGPREGREERQMKIADDYGAFPVSMYLYVQLGM